MKKNLIALAVTTILVAPGIVFAGATIYGKTQLELVSTSASDGSGRNEGLTLGDGARNGKINKGNASGIGVKGSHNLGNGLTAIYNVNFDLLIDDNSGLVKGRNASIGLKSSFGTIKAGTIASPYKSSTAKWDPLVSTFMQAREGSGASKIFNGYDANSIVYSNKFGHYKVKLSLIIDESTDDTAGELDGDHGFSASLNMPINSNIDFAIAMHDNGSDDSTATQFGAKWKSGKIGAVLRFETLDKGLDNSGDHMYANFTMGTANNGTVVLAIGTRNADDGDPDGTYTAIGYKQKISKKVSAHAGYVNHDEGSLGKGEDVSHFGAGLRIAF